MTKDPPASKTIQLAVWILSLCPLEKTLKSAEDLFNRYLAPAPIDKDSTQNGAAQQSLLLILCPMEQIEYIDISPFQPLIDVISRLSGEQSREGSVVLFVSFNL